MAAVQEAAAEASGTGTTDGAADAGETTDTPGGSGDMTGAEAETSEATETTTPAASMY